MHQTSADPVMVSMGKLPTISKKTQLDVRQLSPAGATKFVKRRPLLLLGFRLSPFCSAPYHCRKIGARKSLRGSSAIAGPEVSFGSENPFLRIAHVKEGRLPGALRILGFDRGTDLRMLSADMRSKITSPGFIAARKADGISQRPGQHAE